MTVVHGHSSATCLGHVFRAAGWDMMHSVEGSSPPLRVRLLGGLTIDGFSETGLGSRKARLLIGALALARGRPLTLDTLADLLWGVDQPARPDEQLGVLVSRLRSVLGRDRIVRGDAGYALRVDWLDLDELEALVEQATRALRRGSVGAARASGGAAIGLVRGPLLPADDGEWVARERVRVDALVATARTVAASAALSAGDFESAEHAADRALVHDPYDEAALRILMRALAASGRPASALAAYASVRDRLVEDLGVSPTNETEALHTSIVRGDLDVGGAMMTAPTSPTRLLVGRGAELDELEHVLDTAAGGLAQVVAIEGEAGLGKTALLDEFARRARALGQRVVAIGADHLGRDLPLQPLLDGLSRATDTPRAGLDPALGAASAGRGDPMIDPDAERRRWFGSVLSTLDEQATPGGATLLTVDDAGRADATTRAFLAWAHARPAAVMIVVAVRPGDGIDVAHRVRVRPLGADDTAEMLDGLVAPDRVASIHARSGGNAAFALALARAGDDRLPDSIADSVHELVGSLDSDAGDVLRAAATLGMEIDVDVIAGVLDRSPIVVIDALERACVGGLLFERGEGFVFSHDVAREVLETSTGPARRALLHREAARALDARADRDPLSIAVHARLGGDPHLAARGFIDAATVSFDRADLVGAEGLLRAALHAAESATAHLALARVLMVAQRLDDAAEHADRAVALGGGAEAMETAGWVAYYRRHLSRAQHFADEACARAEPGSAVHAGALALGGRVRHGAGDLADADRRLSSALDGPHQVRGVAAVWLGQVRLHQGRPLDALDLSDRALLDPGHLDHPFASLHGRFGRAIAFGQLGRVEDALAACDELDVAIGRAGAIGHRFPAVAMNVRAWLLRSTGRGTEADELNRHAIERNGASDGSGPSSEGFAEAYWVAWLDLLDGRLAAGDVGGAGAISERLSIVDTWAGTMAWHQRHRLGVARARLAAITGDADGAAELAGWVRDDAARLGAERYAALAHLHLALVGGDGDLDRIDHMLATARRCAALEGWVVASALGRTLRQDRWRRLAADWAADVVRACPADHVGEMTSLVGSVLDG